MRAFLKGEQCRSYSVSSKTPADASNSLSTMVYVSSTQHPETNTRRVSKIHAQMIISIAAQNTNCSETSIASFLC